LQLVRDAETQRRSDEETETQKDGKTEIQRESYTDKEKPETKKYKRTEKGGKNRKTKKTERQKRQNDYKKPGDQLTNPANWCLFDSQTKMSLSRGILEAPIHIPSR
jgi:hypothetical protein